MEGGDSRSSDSELVFRACPRGCMKLPAPADATTCSGGVEREGFTRRKPKGLSSSSASMVIGKLIGERLTEGRRVGAGDLFVVGGFLASGLEEDGDGEEK